MEENNFLQIYDLILTTSSPLFIGDGKILRKNCYLFQTYKNSITIFDEGKLFSLLIRRGLVNAYEEFMIGPANNLYIFLTRQCRLTQQDLDSVVRYKMNVGDVLDNSHSLKDIHTFIRNAYGQAYIPGSSVKGALRTSLLCHMILGDANPETRASYNAEKFDNQLAERYLHTLGLNSENSGDMVNSLMRGIQISDSLPIADENMVLVMEKDARIDGSFSSGRGIICRESIKPNTQIRLKLTLDQSILKHRITKGTLEEAIYSFNKYYLTTYLKHFPLPKNSADVSYKNSLVLGGGAGFFSKTLVYPYLGEKQGLKNTSKMMESEFGKKIHGMDDDLGISPHTLKYARYNLKNYPMGFCGVEIL